jgi:hypothetical protein
MHSTQRRSGSKSKKLNGMAKVSVTDKAPAFHQINCPIYLFVILERIGMTIRILDWDWAYIFQRKL